MAESTAPPSDAGQARKMPKAGPFSYVWAFFGIVHVSVLFTSIFFNCNVIPTVSFFFIAPLSFTLHQRIITFMGAMAHSGVFFWCERIGGMKQFYYGDIPLLQSKYTASKILIANHQSFTDSVILYGLAWRMGEVAGMRVFAKMSLKKWPVIGWMWSYLNFIFLTRNLQKDAPMIKKQLEDLVANSKHYSTGNFWLMIYPEGTRCRPASITAGQQYSKEKGLPVFDHTLVPRVKGLQLTLSSVHKSIDSVLDVTIGYKECRPKDGKVIPSLEALLCGGWRTYDVHVHVRAIPVSEVPTDEEAISAWMMKVFEEKNKLLAQFKATGSFPGPLEASAALPRQASFLTLASNILLFAVIASATAATMLYSVVLAYSQIGAAMSTA